MRKITLQHERGHRVTQTYEVVRENDITNMRDEIVEQVIVKLPSTGRQAYVNVFWDSKAEMIVDEHVGVLPMKVIDQFGGEA
jgi:hypothetical protein